MAATTKRDYTISLLNFEPDSYLERTSRPIYALLFLLPFIAFYELGTFFINTDLISRSEVRVVAFVWMQEFLRYLGFGTRFAWAAPALATIIILLALQLASRKKWRVYVTDLLPMGLESLLLAVPLVVLSLFFNMLAALPEAEQAVSLSQCVAALNTGVQQGGLLTSLVTGVGAGIYEELVFRLILICLLMVVFQDLLRMEHHRSIVIAVVVSAALFSAHHHVFYFNGVLETSLPFSWTEFIFRSLAGVYFAILFAIRGFGITAATHAFYDIIAVFINVLFFSS